MGIAGAARGHGELGRVPFASAGLRFGQESCHSCHSCHFAPLNSYLTTIGKIARLPLEGPIKINQLLSVTVRSRAPNSR